MRTKLKMFMQSLSRYLFLIIYAPFLIIAFTIGGITLAIKNIIREFLAMVEDWEDPTDYDYMEEEMQQLIRLFLNL